MSKRYSRWYAGGMALAVMLNGKSREFAALNDGATTAALVAELGLKADRVAVEHNGEIVPRGRWGEDAVRDGDKLEVVHFVGGGRGQPAVMKCT